MIGLRALRPLRDFAKAMNEPPPEPNDPAAPPPYRLYALLTFWGGLAVAGLNPPGPTARGATIVAAFGAIWYLGLWLNHRWRRAHRGRK